MKNTSRARFSSTYTKIGTIQRRLAWPLLKDDTKNTSQLSVKVFVTNTIHRPI